MKEEKKTSEVKELVGEASKAIDPKDEPTIDEETLQKYRNHYRTRFLHHGYDDREPHNLEVMVRYCAQYYAGTVKKGLCLVGEPGRGKTFAFKIMSKMFGKESQFFPAADLVDSWELFGTDGRREFYAMLKGHKHFGSNQPNFDRIWRDCIIDDIGTEPILNDYGTKREVIDSVIHHRTREFEDCGARTHLSCNLSMDGMEERYGARFVSRIHQLCHVVVLKGTDRRKDGVK